MATTIRTLVDRLRGILAADEWGSKHVTVTSKPAMLLCKDYFAYSQPKLWERVYAEVVTCGWTLRQDGSNYFLDEKTDYN